MHSTDPTPLARHVLFMIGLSIAAGTIAGIHALVTDLPAQQVMQAPENSACHPISLEDLYHSCTIRGDKEKCREGCRQYCRDYNAQCGSTLCRGLD